MSADSPLWLADHLAEYLERYETEMDEEDYSLLVHALEILQAHATQTVGPK